MPSKWLIVFLLQLGVWEGARAASNLTMIGFFGLGNVSKSFVHKVTLPTPRPDSDFRVVYGNETYGFFSKSAEAIEGASEAITLSIVPPGYQHPLEFLLVEDGKVTFRTTKSFVNKMPRPFHDVEITQSGVFSTPFIVQSNGLQKSGPTPKKLSKPRAPHFHWQVSFLFITNRIGEIVWIYSPYHGKRQFSEYVVTKPLDRGRFAIQSCREHTFGAFNFKAASESLGHCYFQIVDYKGHPQLSLDNRDRRLPNKRFHHDFILDESNGKLTNLVQDRFYTYRLKKDPLGSPRKFVGDSIQEIDLNRMQSNIAIRLTDFMNPLWNPYDDPSPRKAKKMAARDFFHANSLENIPGQGYLISLRNHDRVIMLDENLRSVKWTVGKSPQDTFQIDRTKDRFYHQHTPIILSNGNLAVFDNGRKSTRVLEYRLDEEAGKARLVQTYVPGVFAPRRGSVQELPNGSLLAYFPDLTFLNAQMQEQASVSERGHPSARDAIIEFDRTGKQMAKQTIRIGPAHRGYRGLGLKTINGDAFLGFSPDAKRPTNSPR